MVNERPKKPGQPGQSLPITQKNTPSKPKRVITTGVGKGNGNNTGRDNGGRPSPWLNPENEPNPPAAASFVEYLRWMRAKSDNNLVNSGTLLDLLNRFKHNDLSATLNRLTQKTRTLAHDSFEATCSWRIRVGGAKGPESMLLPAFDSLGMPYIPSSTIRGVARAIASRDSKFTQEQIKDIFGDVIPHSSMGKVIFLDAYPLPGNNKQGGLKPDMANAIWNWNGDGLPEYDTNPNIFLSLEKPTFVIGIRKTSGCDDATFQQVKQWLVNGLAQGIGSQVNSGYGGLDASELRPVKKKVILKVGFELEGQLIHGRQEFTSWQRNNADTGWKPPGKAEAELRPTAFRSMLRYWFRTFALGIMLPKQVHELENEIFGGIEPKHTGLLRLEVSGEVRRDNAPPTRNGKDKPCGLIVGNLIMRNSSQTASRSEQEKIALEGLLKNLTWMMFHLGGVGQGARRPCYSRNREDGRAPWWRGSTLIAKSQDSFWHLPTSIPGFQKLFHQRLQEFYVALAVLAKRSIDPRSPLSIGKVTKDNWTEAIDANCRIVVCAGNSDFGKPYALATLHSRNLKINGNTYDDNLCGKVEGDGTPSPVWIADLEEYQVVTVFGVDRDTQNRRNQYLKLLHDRAQSYAQIWSLDQ